MVMDWFTFIFMCASLHTESLVFFNMGQVHSGMRSTAHLIWFRTFCLNPQDVCRSSPCYWQSTNTKVFICSHIVVILESINCGIWLGTDKYTNVLQSDVIVHVCAQTVTVGNGFGHRKGSGCFVRKNGTGPQSMSKLSSPYFVQTLQFCVQCNSLMLTSCNSLPSGRIHPELQRCCVTTSARVGATDGKRTRSYHAVCIYVCMYHTACLVYDSGFLCIVYLLTSSLTH